MGPTSPIRPRMMEFGLADPDMKLESRSLLLI